MAECEVCEEYIDEEEIEECHNCGVVLCESHLQKHLKKCGDRFDRDDEDY